jgi:hypothetical protein
MRRHPNAFARITVFLAIAMLPLGLRAAETETRRVKPEDAIPINIVLGARLTTTKDVVKPGVLRVRVLNVIPTAHYTIAWEARTLGHAIPDPFSLAPGSGWSAKGLSPEAVTACESAREAFKRETNGAKSEEVIAKLNSELEKRLNDVECPTDVVKADREAFDKATIITLGDENLEDNQELTLRFTRSEKGNFEARDLFTITFSTPLKSAGTWLSLYGVNFIRGGDERFFASADAAPSTTYTVTSFADRQENDFAPSLYFMWIKPRNYDSRLVRALSWNSRDVFGGLTAGIGFDFDNPTAFLGYGIGWGYNVMLTFGVAMHKEKRLNGRYSPGDVIADNLTEDQLSEETYKPRAYVGLAFRFGSNPFGKKNPPDQASPPN